MKLQKVKYDSYIPRDQLKPFIRLLVITEADSAGDYKVLPGTEVVMGFQFKGKLSFLGEGKASPLSPSGLSGLTDHFRMFRNAPNTGTILIFFKEGAAASFFKTPIHELFRDSVSLDNFMLRSELLILEEKLQETKTDPQKISLIEDFLISKLNSSNPDLLVMSAISMIFKSKGNIRIKELLEALHISQSPLEKRFRQSVGTSPKKFASIVRFKYTLLAFDPKTSLTDLGYEAGFYDQAHFIKEFRNFTGESPEVFFGLK
jgi:AraC-like DNA-binding protein